MSLVGDPVGEEHDSGHNFTTLTVVRENRPRCPLSVCTKVGNE